MPIKRSLNVLVLNLNFKGTISTDSANKNKQVLDSLEVERRRGITVKAQTASMFYNVDDKEYLLNLIDTPVLALC